MCSSVPVSSSTDNNFVNTEIPILRLKISTRKLKKKNEVMCNKQTKY